MTQAQQNRKLGNAAGDDWRTAVTEGLARLGWSDRVRIDQPAEDVTLVIFDAQLDRDVTIGLEGPGTFSLSVILDGGGTLSVSGLPPVEILPGTAVLFASNGTASGVNVLRGGRRFRGVDIRFEESFLQRAGGVALGSAGADLMQAADSGSNRVFLAGFPASREMLRLATEIMDASATDTLAKRFTLQGKAIEMLGAALGALDRSAEPKALRQQDRAKLDRARVILERRYNEDWTIARLAREVGLGEKQLKAGFRTVSGRTVHAQLTAIRLEAAARHLDDGTKVTEAALAVGFTNLSHFSKVFREVKGVSPSRYARGR